MSLTIQVPPVMENEAIEYATSCGETLEELLFNCLRREMSERRERQNWATRFNNLLSRTESRNTTVYEFNRADAYEPEVTFA